MKQRGNMAPAVIVVILIILAIVVLSQRRESTPSQQETQEEMVLGEYGYYGELLSGSEEGALLLEFRQQDYERALEEKRVVVLYFYANWCPRCKEEFPYFEDAIDQIDSTDVIGFRVNFNDGDTTQEEKALAQEFGVPYQHTKVILVDGERVLKSPEEWERDRYITEINAQLQ